MKNLLKIWQEGWREAIYLIGFSIILNILSVPFFILKLDFFREKIIARLSVYIILIIFWLPFMVYWASKISGFRAPTEKEAKEKEKKQREEYERLRLNRKMNKIEPDTSDSDTAPVELE